MTDEAKIAASLTKAARRSLPRLSREWTLCTGRLRVDCYGLWWGKMHHLGLVDAPRWPANTLAHFEMRLTPLGLAVRDLLRAESDPTEKP